VLIGIGEECFYVSRKIQNKYVSLLGFVGMVSPGMAINSFCPMLEILLPDTALDFRNGNQNPGVQNVHAGSKM